jgi:hypothetical protein
MEETHFTPADILFDEQGTEAPEAEDIRWGLAVPERWHHRGPRPTSEVWEAVLAQRAARRLVRA